MEINKHWKIEADNLNIILLATEKHKDGTETWEIEGYFSTVGHALKYLVDAEVRGTGMKDLTAVCCKISELQRLIDQLAISHWSYSDLSPEQEKNTASTEFEGGITQNTQEDTGGSLAGTPTEL